MDEIEEKIPHLKQFALHEFGVEVTLVDRRNVFYPNGKHDEVNLYVEGKKDGHTQYLIGECKAQPGKKDFDKFGQDTACFGAGSQWLVASMIQLPFYARLKNRAIFKTIKVRDITQFLELTPKQ
jgi:hypothetical protein